MADVNYTFSTISEGRAKTVTPGTAVALAASATPARVVKIKAFADNTDKVVVGSSGVVAALATRKGIELAPGEAVDIRIDDVSKVYVDSVVAGEGVAYVSLSN